MTAIAITLRRFAEWERVRGLIGLLRFLTYSGSLNSGTANPGAYLGQTLFVVRYLLLCLTAVLYLAGPPAAPLLIKVGVVLALLVGTVLAQNLYHSSGNGFSRFRLIGMETLGVAILILPTGALDSPFIWYAFNPILAAAVYLPALYCWGLLFTFLAVAFKASYLYNQYFYPGLVYSELHVSTPALMLQHSELILLFFFLTFLVRVAVSLFKRLSAAYEKLDEAHQVTEQSLAHISSLYQALEAVSGQEDRAQLARLLAVYTNRLCGRPAVCFLTGAGDGAGNENKNENDGAPLLRTCDYDGTSSRTGDSAQADRVDWKQELHRLRDKMGTAEGLESYLVGDGKKRIRCMPLRAHGENFGFLAYASPAEESGNVEREKALAFLAELGAITLERLEAEKLWGHLLVSEEQNRIANEIHDGVSQHLFSIVCALHGLSQQRTNLQDEKIQAQLQLLENTASRASGELRASIYKISPHKRGESIFTDNLAAYLDDLARLNNVRTDLEAEGSEEVLSPALRKGLYRIVREAAGNAIRHGDCRSLKVRLWMRPGRTVLEVEDDGHGYRPGPGTKPEGLGIRNMKQLTESFNGELEIEGVPGRGTLVKCTVPRKYSYEKAL